MKSFVRIISLALLVLIAVSPLALTGCHQRRELEPFSLTGEIDMNKTYEITFWAKNENNETQRAVYADAIARFEALYPNIKITLRNFTDYGEIYNNVITNISSNTTPNVCITYPDHIATYISGENLVVPLDELMAHEKWGLGSDELKFDAPTKGEIVPQFLEEGKIGGTQYALPFMRSTEVCYVNKTLVEELGFTLDKDTFTWDFVWDVCETAMKLGKQTVTDENGKSVQVYVANGQKTFIPFIYKSTDNMMISMLRQMNAPYSNDDGEILIFNDSTKSVLEDVYKYTKSGSFSTFKISSYPGNFINQGQCIFGIDSTAGATWMGPNAPMIDVAKENLADFEMEVLPIPQYDPKNPQMISQGPSVCIFNKEDQGEVLASWLFVQFLLSNETQIAYSQTEGYVPVTSKAQSSDEYQDYLSREGEDNDLYYDIKIKSAKLLLENIDNTFTTAVFNGSTSLRNAAGELIEDVAKAARRKKTVDDTYLADLYRRVMVLYKLDRISEQQLGALPGGSVALLVTLGAVWTCLGAYFVISYIKKRKNE